MAKIKKRRLKWTESSSSQAIGYKLYWSQNKEVDYESNCEMVGKVTEIILPDDVKTFNPGSGPVEFGITAIDEIGNESDMVTLTAPYQFNVPEAPDDLHLDNIDDYYITCVKDYESDERETIEIVEFDNRFKSKQS
jgi:hypothetical protein